MKTPAVRRARSDSGTDSSIIVDLASPLPSFTVSNVRAGPPGSPLIARALLHIATAVHLDVVAVLGPHGPFVAASRVECPAGAHRVDGVQFSRTMKAAVLAAIELQLGVKPPPTTDSPFSADRRVAARASKKRAAQGQAAIKSARRDDTFARGESGLAAAMEAI